MRRLAVALCCLSCVEWRMAPTFPEQAAERPVVHEQALLGLSEDGDAAVVELVDAEGEDPRLLAFVWGREGGRPRALLAAPPDRARIVAARIRELGHRPAPLLAAEVERDWPQALQAAARAGHSARAPAPAGQGGDTWEVEGAPAAGALPLSLRLARIGQRASILLLSDGGGEEIEIARMPLAGTALPAQLFVRGGAAWLLGGSVLPGDPLRRAVGLRRVSLLRGESRLHNSHGLQDSAAGDVEAARREFDRAIGADPGFVDALYNAAAAAALAHIPEEAVALLRRAAAIDPARVQVLGRNDLDLESIRAREDVRALLGLQRMPPRGVPPPP